MSIIYIALSQGLCATIDKADIPLVTGRKWHARKCGSRWYAATKSPRSEGGKTIYRFVTRSENSANRKKVFAASGVVGVYSRSHGRWYGRVRKDGKYHFTQTFPSIAEASAARKELFSTLFPNL